MTTATNCPIALFELQKQTVMRLWSVHPQFLDVKGLLACWREGLLARKVLLGETKGYRNHPQLLRFRRCSDPVAAIDSFLFEIFSESQRRGFRFDASKIRPQSEVEKISVTRGQLEYEARHLKNKLLQRDPAALKRLELEHALEPHPLFVVVEGEIESWEILPDSYTNGRY